jgi:tetratricopeptide (TPR) repeat protein
MHEIRPDESRSACDKTFHSKPLVAGVLNVSEVGRKTRRMMQKIKQLDAFPTRPRQFRKTKIRLNLSHPLDLSAPLRNNLRCCMPQKSSVRSKKLSRKEVRDLETKISFLEGIVRREPAFVEALQILGDHYTQRGLYDQGLKIDQQLSRLEPRNALVFYNLACSYSLIRDFERAAESLETALSLGYRDFNWLVRDPDLRYLRKHPCYRHIADKIRKMKIEIA